MKQSSPELITLLNSRDFQRADLYTLTLRGGSVIRLSGEDQDIYYLGNKFEAGPLISRDRIQDVMGLETATLDITLSVKSQDPSDQYSINSVPLIDFIASQGLNGATLKLERAFFPDWGDPVTGAIVRFAGKVTSINQVEGLTAKLTVSSWALLLNVNYPAEVYQAGCMWTVYNQGCGLDEADFTYSFSATSGSTTSQINVASGGGNNFQQGRIVFTSGPNNGLSRTIRASTNTSFSIIPPLPVAPALGDTFDASFGCDLTYGTCETRFNNKIRNKSTPFVPLPETSI